MLKKFLALIPFLVLVFFISWMARNYMGELVVQVPEGESYTVSFKGQDAMEISETTSWDVWAQDYEVEVSKEGYKSGSYSVSIPYHGSGSVAPDLVLDFGLRTTSVEVPFSLKGVYVASGEYRDNQQEVIMKYGMPDFLKEEQVDLSGLPRDVFRAHFSPTMKYVIVRAGDLVREVTSVYSVRDGSLTDIEGDVLSVDWSGDGESFAFLRRLHGSVEVGVAHMNDMRLTDVTERVTVRVLREVKDIDSGQVAYSPSGDRLILFSMGRLPDRNLYVINIPNADFKKITFGGFVYGYRMFDDGRRILIDRAGNGSALRSLWVKNLVSGDEKRLADLSADITKAIPYKESVLLVADKAVRLENVEPLQEEDDLTLGGLADEFSDRFATLGSAMDYSNLESYFLYDMETGDRRMVYNNETFEMDVRDMIVSPSGTGAYLLNTDSVYFLTFEIR